MAGVIPKKTASGRKQWTLHGSQRNSLKRLRSQLASDGCPESQVVLAKQLLDDDECDSKSEKKENARLGVYWLIKASEQGNLEATDLLKMCLRSGKGINEHNYMDVKSCITMTQDEKIVRRAAKEMFASLSNGEEYITSNQLQRRILDIDRGEGCSKQTTTRNLENDVSHMNGELINHYEDPSDSDEETDWSQKSELNNEKLTEDNIVTAAVAFSHGSLPVVNNIMCLAEPDLRALDHIPFVYWSILHPILCLKILYFKLIKYLGSKSLPFSLPTTEIQILLLFSVYYLTSFNHVVYFVPTAIFYASFITMVVTTFQMLQIQREQHDFRLWRGLFICYSNGDLNESSFETQFILNHTKPYAWYFFSLLVHYFCYSLAPSKPESEFTLVSCCFMFMTLFGFMPTRRSKTIFDSLVLLSFAVNILARYPYDTDPIVSKGWRYLELKVPSFPSYVVGNGIEFCISFRLVLYALIPLILIKMAAKSKWRGTYQVLLPHLVTLSWLQYFALCSHNATMYGLYRATLALVGSVLFLPLVGLMSVILPVAALSKWVVTSNLIFTIGVFLFLFIICLAVCYALAYTRYAQYTAILQIVLMLVAFLVLIKTSEHASAISDGYDVVNIESKSLDWESFQKYCHQQVWEQKENTANAQTRCAQLENVNVFWEGSIIDVELMSIKNKYKSFFDKFPKFIANHLYCLYGMNIKDMCDSTDSPSIDCNFLQETISKQCSLDEYNSYTYKAKVKMSSLFWSTTPEIHLLLTNEFKNFTLRLKPNDQVWFKGVLTNNKNVGFENFLGSFNIQVKVEEVGCISCTDYELSSVKLPQVRTLGLDIIFRLYDSIKFVLNVMFNPVLIFK